MPALRNDMSGMTDVPHVRQNSPSRPEVNKLVLCFDGTGNTFTGSSSDTNVVKLLNKLENNHSRQYHYYQTGIGTYDVNDPTVNRTWLGQLSNNISFTIDQGFGTTFDAHVMAGYKFLMNYYEPGDKIYMFGFSRGAFTAKFLSRMISTVGLLCKGNEEMIPFAYRLYQRYLAGEIEEIEVATCKKKHDRCNSVGPDGKMDRPGARSPSPVLQLGDVADENLRPKYKKTRSEITAFKDTFCRKDMSGPDGEERDIKVFFLGIWDCVNSVAVLENNTPHPVPVKGTAHYVRHAVSVDECRVKFKPALLAQDIRACDHTEEDIQEVWFPGNHGDVGGGWPLEEEEDEVYKQPKPTGWQKFKKKFFGRRKTRESTPDIGNDRLQMSDISLSWMIQEVERVGHEHSDAALQWTKRKDSFQKRFKASKEQAFRSYLHDTLNFGRGSAFSKVVFWKFLEYLPTVTRWELEENKWRNVRFPLNKGNARDIPPDAVLHHSVVWRLHKDPEYHPRNNHGGRLPPCLKNGSWIAQFEPLAEAKVTVDEDHQLFTFSSADDA